MALNVRTDLPDLDARPNINPISGWFWKFVRARSARFAGRSTLRIYKNDGQPSASRAACQPINSCAAQLSGQVLMFQGKIGQGFGAFTNTTNSEIPVSHLEAFPSIFLLFLRSFQP